MKKPIPNVDAILACLAGIDYFAQAQLFDRSLECRCAVGEILHCSGVADEELAAFDREKQGNGQEEYDAALFAFASPRLKPEYGITDVHHLRVIMTASDNNWRDGNLVRQAIREAFV
jgi:hypothetical protein